jgi:hypothetical protein
VRQDRCSRRSFVALGLLAAALLTLIAPRPAAADHSLQALTTITTGYTDNVELVPENGDPAMTPPVSSDAFANIAPGMIFSHQGHRITQVLRYTLNIRLYAEASGANSFSNALLYGAVVPLTVRSGLTIDLSAAHGRQNAFDTAPQDTPVATQAQGDQSYATVAGGMAYAYELTRSWQYQQSIGASLYEPLDETVQIGRRTSFDAGIGLSKTFNFHAFTLTGRGSYAIIDGGVNANNEEVADQRTILFGPELRWVHDLSQDFSTDAMIGVTVTAPADDFERRSVFPVGGAFLRYAHDRYAASIGYRRTVATNVIVGETEATHVGEARGVVPLPWGDRLSASGAVGYANGEGTRVLDGAGNETQTSTVQWIGDLSLSWQITDAVSTALRYQLVRQNRGEDPPVMPGDEEERTRRQQITLILEGRYPTRQAAELPRDPSSRVDGGLESMAKREESLVR